jgi:hypothetical protein
MKEIIPTNGDSPIKVDDEDYPLLSRFTWYVSDTGYAMTQIRGKKHIKMHHLVWGTIENKCLVIDHLNNNRLDNRKSNLRLCTQKENSNNRDAKGYCWDKNKGKYIVRYKGKFYGRYVTEEEAEEAFKKACSGVEYHPRTRRRYMLPRGVLYMRSQSKSGRPYYCRPQVKNKKYFLGYFATPELALEAYHKLIKELGKED